MSDIRGKRPKVLGARVAGLRLTQEERFVMARIDGELSVEQLVGVTGLAPERLEQIVSKLAFDGALELASDPRAMAPNIGAHDSGTTSLEEFAAALGMAPTGLGAPASPPAAAPAKPRKVVKIVRRKAPDSPEQPAADAPPRADDLPLPDDLPLADAGSSSDVSTTDDAHAAEDVTLTQESAPSPRAAAAAARELAMAKRVERAEDLPEMVDLPELEPAGEGGEPAGAPVDGDAPSDGAAADEAADGAAEPLATDKDDEVGRATAERSYRQLYESRWHPLPVDARTHAAKAASGTDLLALCFDHDARVIIALLDNASLGLEHVRLIATHHRTTTALEVMARRQEWLRDMQVERRLLRNPMIGEIVLGRIMNPKRLHPTYKIAIDRDIPELSRVKCRGMIRQKWGTAPSEERADLLLRTEARCLMLMTGCTFDAKTTAILCGRPINSAMFVQSIAKFAAAPPALLAHLFKQPFVRKNPGLRKLLLQHPNMPGDIKRQV